MAHIVATVPPDRRWIIKDLAFRNYSVTTAVLIDCFLGTIMFKKITVPPDSILIDIERFVVGNAGDNLQLRGTPLETVEWYISGASLDLTPDG